MYSDDDLNAAVEAGAIPPEAAARFRAFVAARQQSAIADEESFRLLGGFNDIFVALALGLTLWAVAYLLEATLPGVSPFAVAGASWGFAEYFTRRRRMALPSFFLALVFVAACAFLAAAVAKGVGLGDDPEAMGAYAAGFAGGAIAAYAHWRRFRVPVTMAALVLGMLGLALAIAFLAVPALLEWWTMCLLAAGLLAFAAALRWDASDPERITRRSDVALWLHLAAAPLIVHPLFAALGLLGGEGGPVQALAAVGIYAAFMLVALVIDRRALLVAALAYVIYAVSDLLAAGGGIAAVVPTAMLAIGLLLLTLSAWWRGLRRPLVALLPAGLRRLLPAA
jgi:hypothetical protein